MASYTKNLNLLKKDPVADGADTFNIETMLNENWDKIDENVATGAAMQAHITNQKNPHNVTAAQIGAAASVHSHTMGQVEGLNTALSNKADLMDGEVQPSQLPQLHNDVTLYVNATTGNDENPGTQQYPFATIQAAVDSIPKNLSVYRFVINIADGTYNEDVLVFGFYGTGAKLEYFRFYGISFVGSSGVTVRSIKFVNNLIPYIFVSGITVSGGTSIKQGGIEAGTGIVVQGCNHVDIDNCNITNCVNGLQVGTYYTTGGTTVFAEGCSISNCTNYAIFTTGTNTVFLLKITGSGNSIGLVASYGGHIISQSLTLEATTEQTIYAGFIDKF